MSFRLWVLILAIYPATRWSVGIPHPVNIDGNVDISLAKMEVVKEAVHKDDEYPDSINDMIPKLERKSRELGIALKNIRHDGCLYFYDDVLISTIDF